MAQKAGSDGQVRQSAAEWAADTRTFPEGERLFVTDTGDLYISNGGTFADAWGPYSASGGGPPSGPAGGDLTGTYPNPTIANNAVTTAKIANGNVTLNKLPSQADLTVLGNFSGSPGNPSAVTVVGADLIGRAACCRCGVPERRTCTGPEARHKD